MQVCRYMVQGVDVWLNNPRRPKEASGTSGMKVIYNGGLNFSILDGWWAEAYDPEVGWAIGNGEEYGEDEWEHQDYIEAQALYNVLEQDIIPMFYDRGRDGLPRFWIQKVKQSMKKLAPYFNTRRMVQEYTDQYYVPCLRLIHKMRENPQEAVKYANWRDKLDKVWNRISVKEVNVPQRQIKVGNSIDIQAVVDLGELTPQDVRVELYYGPLNRRGEIGDMGGEHVEMQPMNGAAGAGVHTFKAQVQYTSSGDRGISVRVVPNHELLSTPFQPRLITWA
jgi:glycogen phosphorylase